MSASWKSSSTQPTGIACTGRRLAVRTAPRPTTTASPPSSALTDGTRVTIIGRQQFTLPLFWQVFDLDLVPDLKARLVTHAYQTFFDRTIANFEALVEGRDIRIGRPMDEPAPVAAEQLMPLLQKLGETAMPLLQRTLRGDTAQADASQWTDADGFTHGTSVTETSATEPDRWMAELSRFVEGLRRAAQRDLNLVT